MRAVVMNETGGPDVLAVGEVPDPAPAPGTVLVRVAAAGVNFADVMSRQGMYLTRDTVPSLPAVPGTEVAGVVVDVGEGVDPGLLGARVVAFVEGGYAELALAPAHLVTVVPTDVDLGDAVAFLVQGVTAHQALLECGRLAPGESVLVHAGAGGVGSLAVQLARLHGAGRVIATAGTPAKRELCLELGADVALDYTQPGWHDEVLAATDGRGVDVVVDGVGGEVGELSLGALAPFGRMVVVGLAGKQIAAFAGSQLMQHNQSVSGYWLTARLASRPGTVDAVAALLEWAAAGKLRPVVRHVFALDGAADAHRALGSRDTTGKVLLTP